MRALVLLASLGCSELETHQTPTSAPSTFFEIDGFSLGFEVPANWKRARLARGYAFTGPGDLAFTPLVVQARRSGAPVEAALEQLAQPVEDFPNFAWVEKSPVAVGGVLAVRYEMTFDLHETTRRRHGVVLPIKEGLVDLAVTGNQPLMVSALPFFDRAINTLDLCLSTPHSF